MADEALRVLLIAELRKHEAQLLNPDATSDQLRRALHAAKGSAGIAGERAAV